MSQAVLSQAAISVLFIESSVVRCTDVFVCRDVLSVGLHSDDLRRPKYVTHDNERSCLILQGNERNIPDGLAPGTIGRPKIGECRSCSAGNLRGASCFTPRSRIFAPGADICSGARSKCSLMQGLSTGVRSPHSFREHFPVNRPARGVICVTRCR